MFFTPINFTWKDFGFDLVGFDVIQTCVDHRNRARYYHGAGGGFSGGATMVHGEHHCNGGGGGSYSDDPNAIFDHHYVKFGECKIKKLWICIIFLNILAVSFLFSIFYVQLCIEGWIWENVNRICKKGKWRGIAVWMWDLWG